MLPRAGAPCKVSRRPCVLQYGSVYLAEELGWLFGTISATGWSSPRNVHDLVDTVSMLPSRRCPGNTWEIRRKSVPPTRGATP